MTAVVHGRAWRARLARDAPNVAPPPGNPRFELFDALRAIAALTVFTAHLFLQTKTEQAHPFFQWAHQLAGEGVVIFFLISGFLLYRPFLVARQDGCRLKLTDYARRRVLRIVPAYWVALVVVILVFQHPNGVTNDWWAHAAFLQNYFDSTRPDGIGAAWSLCVEATFYMALPMIAYLGARLSSRAGFRGDIGLIAALTVASLAFHTWVLSGDIHRSRLVQTLPGSFYWFALGMGLAIASVTISGDNRVVRFVTRHPTVCWVGAVVAFVAMYNFISDRADPNGTTWDYLAYGLVALLVLLPAVFGDHSGGLPRRVLRTRALAWTGLVSYAFYLYHADVISVISSRPEFAFLPDSVPLLGVEAFVATATISALSYYLVERPILRFKNRRLRTVFAGRARRLRGGTGPFT